ncbi:putative calcium-transporting ATPase 13, plasma membrane-type [Rhododendron vialii]|uniref:putative calcium-transporting ATPase 13, plasma membrane-type n=1 Tax=Rhododendron vialii TaxID=182163 RepID=UPI00265FA8C1|nr:putative calcium-transporting ATPase 13, plasma membrane-type [Rhododendron vialii]
MSSKFQATISLDSIVIDIVEPHPNFPEIVQSVLTQIVKQKNLDQLREYGGVEGLASSLKTNLKHGINGDVEDISRRKEAFGSNTYPRPPGKKLFDFVLESLREPTSLIILACAAVSLGLEIKQHGLKKGWYDGGSIFVTVFVVTAISAIVKFRQNRRFVKLSEVSNIQVDVLRNRGEQKVDRSEIVVGDVVCLNNGDQVPADGLFIGGHSLLVDESSMTAETNPVEVDLNHNHNNPFLFSDTKVTSGNGRMLVTSVGMNTTLGEIITINIDSNEHTPLKYKLNKLTSSIGKVVLSVAFLVQVVLLIRYFTGNQKDMNGKAEYNSSKTKAYDILNSVFDIIAAPITILVDAIQGGLPVAVTLSLAHSMKRMMSDQAMVGKLSACETMGFATTICTDKTGTLTLNHMKVTTFWLGQDCIEEKGISSVATSVVELLHHGIGLNTTGSVNMSASGSEFEFSGSPTEKAILSWAVSELNLDMEGLKQSGEILHVEAFNSTKKRSGVLMRNGEQNTMNLHIKGGAEMVLAMCSNYYDVSGTIKVLDDDERRIFDGIIQGMEASSLRCIAFAHKQVPEEEHEEGKNQIEENCLTLLGLVGLMDTCRPGVKEAVQEFQYAGVNVKMVTGDNIFTARAIATECGILKPNQDMESGAVVLGEQFRNYTPEERMEKVNNISVMARASPRDKLLMVQCLKQKDHVVAVIGDGTNDAPALKEADIGLSMGQGTEEAKDCSDIVILDDSFGSVATFLRWGRCVCTNVQKFIQLQLTLTVATLAINFVVSVSTGEVPLSAVELVWVNLIISTSAALPLATEKPTEELMENPPVGRTKQLITNVMWRNLLCQALYQTAVLLTLQFKGEAIFKVNANVNDTLILNVLALCQVFNVIFLWKLENKNVFEGIHKNHLFLVIIGLTIAVQVVVVEFLKKVAGTERLNWWQWGVCVGFASVSWPIGWVVKWIPVPEKPFLLHPSLPPISRTSFSSTPLELDPASGAHSDEKVLSGDLELVPVQGK